MHRQLPLHLLRRRQRRRTGSPRYPVGTSSGAAGGRVGTAARTPPMLTRTADSSEALLLRVRWRAELLVHAPWRHANMRHKMPCAVC